MTASLASARRAGVGFKPQHFDAHPCRRTADRLRRSPCRELHGRGRAAACHAAAVARALRAVDPRRRPVDRFGSSRSTREHLARLKTLCDRYEPAKLFRASRLVVAWRGLSQRSAAPALHAGDARPHRRAYRSGAGHARPRDAAGKSVDLSAIRGEHDSRDRVPRRDRAPHRLRPAARRQQRVRAGGNHGTIARGLSRGLSARAGEGNPSRRP